MDFDKIVTPVATKVEGKITLNGRELNIPQEIKIVGVQNDNLVENISFEIPRYFDEVNDLDEFTIRLNWANADRYKDSSDLEKQTNEDSIVLTWKVPDKLVAVDGEVEIALYAFHSDGRRWNSAPAKMGVLRGIVVSDSIQKDYPDVIAELLSRTQTLETNTTPSKLNEMIKSYVDKVMQKVNERIDNFASMIDRKINDFIKKFKPFKRYDTTLEMLADVSLKNGDRVKTLGYETVNDGGEAEFVITDTDFSLTISDAKLQLNLTNGLFATLIADVPNTAQCPSKFIDMMKLYETVNVNCDLTLNESLTIDDSFKLSKLTSNEYQKFAIKSKEIYLNKSTVTVENLKFDGDGVTDGIILGGSYLTIKNNSIYDYLTGIKNDTDSYLVNPHIENNTLGYCQNGITLYNENNYCMSNLKLIHNYVVKNGKDAENTSSVGDETSYGIKLGSFSGGVVTENVIEYNAGYGMYLQTYKNAFINSLALFGNYFENNKICNFYFSMKAEQGYIFKSRIYSNFFNNPLPTVSNTMNPRDINGENLYTLTTAYTSNNSFDILDSCLVGNYTFNIPFMVENNIDSNYPFIDKENNCLNFSKGVKLSVGFKLTKGKYKLTMHFINPSTSPYLIFGSGPSGLTRFIYSRASDGWVSGEFEIKETAYYTLIDQGGFEHPNLAYDAVTCIPI